jgi:hypothetical protein
MQLANKTYIVRFKNPALSTQPVVASRAAIQGDHIVMHDSEGGLVALFWMAIVESWSEIPHLVMRNMGNQHAGKADRHRRLT